MALSSVKLLNIPKIPDERGNLSFFQNTEQMPFEIKRVCWISDSENGIEKKGYANKEPHEIIIALSGSFEILVNDGKEEKKFVLDQPDMGLYIPKMIWRKLINFSACGIAFIMSDRLIDAADRIADFSQFQLISDYASML